jgi:hypothetical protein
MKRPERNQRLATAIRAALMSGALIGGVAQAQFAAVMPLADLNWMAAMDFVSTASLPRIKVDGRSRLRVMLMAMALTI